MTNLVGQQQSGRVVVGMDGSESSKQALRWAMRQANATGSSVEAIMAWELPTTYAFGAPMPTAYDFAPNCENLSTRWSKTSLASTRPSRCRLS